MPGLTLPELLGASLERHQAKGRAWAFVLAGLAMFGLGMAAALAG